MHDTRRREPSICDLPHPVPRHSRTLTATAKRLVPQLHHREAEARHRGGVSRYTKILIVPSNHRPEPSPDFADRVVQATTQNLFQRRELRSASLRRGLASHREPAIPGSVAVMREAQEIKGLRLALPPSLAILRRKSAKLQQAGFVRMQLQMEPTESLSSTPPGTAPRRPCVGSPGQSRPHNAR